MIGKRLTHDSLSVFYVLSDPFYNRIMRIGFDCRLPYYRLGGISQYILHLLPALATADTSDQFTLFHSRKDPHSYVPQNAANFMRKNLWTPCHHWLERWSLTAELLPHQLDVWHSPDFIPPQHGAHRHIITIHDLNFIFYPQFLTSESRRYYEDQIQWAVTNADHISADSHATRHDLIEQLAVAPDKVTTVHLAANPIYTKPYVETAVQETLRRYHLSPGFILSVGTLEPRKNLPMLIHAYRLLLQETAVDVPLILVGGKGWIYDEIFATIDKLGLREHVHHLEGVYDEQLAHLYHAAGVLVTPSHYEGFGLPALEAQHCGCPVIVSNRGSLPEIVGPKGITLDPDDVELWAKTIRLVLDDQELCERLITQGFQQARQFSWEKAARATLHLYHRTSADELIIDN